jgi:hypothetical protein
MVWLIGGIMTEEKIKESPDKDKTLEETGLEKPPDMGKGDELPEEGKVEEEELSPELEATMKRKGFKTPAELAKAYDASEKKQTELERDARLRSLTAEIPIRPKVERTFTEVPVLTKDPIDMSKEEFEDYQGKREKRFTEELTAKYEDAEADKKWDREYRETMAVVNKDPKRFEQIKPQLQELHAKYPDAPLSEIYSAADKMEKEQGQVRKDGFIKEVFGNDTTQDDIDKLKTVMSKARPAIVSDAGGAGAEAVNKAGEQKAVEVIWDGIEKADKRRE